MEVKRAVCFSFMYHINQDEDKRVHHIHRPFSQTLGFLYNGFRSAQQLWTADLGNTQCVGSGPDLQSVLSFFNMRRLFLEICSVCREQASQISCRLSESSEGREEQNPEEGRVCVPGERAALCCWHQPASCWSPEQRALLLCLTDANCTVSRATVNSVCSFACSPELFVSGSAEPLMSTAAQAETRRRDCASAP